jgi:hypothetical protein
LGQKDLLRQKKIDYAQKLFNKLNKLVNTISAKRNIPKEKIYKILYKYFYTKTKTMT